MSSYVCPSVRTSIHPSTRFRSNFMCVGRSRPHMHINMTSTRSKVNVKVRELLKFGKLHFSRSISSAIFAWSSKLMVGSDSMGPGLQLAGARFPSRKAIMGVLTSNFAECWDFTKFKWPYFCTARGNSHTVRHAGILTRTVHVDMTLAWSKVKVKVIDLLKFRKLHFSTSISFTILESCSQLMGDYDSMGPSLQLFRARFLNFFPSWQSHDFEVREMLISPESTAFYLHAGRG